MTGINIKFNSNKIKKELEKSINKIVDEENQKILIKNIVNERSKNGMLFLNDTEKELLKLILESECDEDGCTYMGTTKEFPEYIAVQIKKLFSILEESGYAAKTYCWLSGNWQVCLTPEGINYFEKEKEYNEMKKNNSINIGTINTNGGFVNFGNASNILYNVDNSYNELNKLIDSNAEEEDKDELKELIEDLKEYIENIAKTQSISKNTGLFKRIGNHINKYQWFYQSVINIIGQSVFMVMNGK